VRDTLNVIADWLRDAWAGTADRGKDISALLRAHPRRTGAGIAVTVVLLALILVVVTADPESESEAALDVGAYRDALVVINDIPAESLINWQLSSIDTMPALSTNDPTVTSDKADCVPGGDRQRAVQQMVYGGTRWSGERFVNLASGRAVIVNLSNSPHTDLNVLDGWLAGCADSTLTVKGVPTPMQLRSLPIDPTFYNLEAARVYTATIKSEGGVATNTLTAYGFSRGVTVQVELTFRGDISDATINQLDAIWRAQTAKLVGLQSLGRVAA
jgi:hypothetical protein